MKKKILICDDDEGILEMIALMLDDEQKQVATEKNSLKIFDRLQAEQPDLLILDLWMPVLSGDQITRQLRAMPEYSGLPILVVSASRDGAVIARNAGASAYMAKPFDMDEFLATIDRLDRRN